MTCQHTDVLRRMCVEPGSSTVLESVSVRLFLVGRVGVEPTAR